MSYRDQPAFRNGDVVYGVGGAFCKKIGLVKKVNAVKPTIQDSKGKLSSFGVLNLKKLGRFGDRFGHCSLCNKPSRYDEECSHGGPGGRGCSGTIVGNLSWKLESRAPALQVNDSPSAECHDRATALLLAKQLGAALRHLGFTEVPEEVINAVRGGFASAPRPTRMRTGPLRVSTPGSSSSESTSHSPPMASPNRTGTWVESFTSSRK